MSEATIHRWATSDGVGLAWREIGAGRPVVLLHGLFSNAEVNWIKFGHAARIAEAGFRVIMPDLRAHGLSDAPHDPAAYPRHVLARDLVELVAHLGVDDYDLGGFSLGSRTVLDALPGGLTPRRALLSGTGIEVLTNWQGRCQFFVEAIEQFDTAPRGDPHWLAIQFMRTMKVDREAARLLLGSMDDHADPHAALAAFTMPTLVLCGSEDQDNGSGAALAEALPNARFEEVPGTHMSSVTKPEFGQAIADFFAAP